MGNAPVSRRDCGTALRQVHTPVSCPILFPFLEPLQEAMVISVSGALEERYDSWSQ